MTRPLDPANVDQAIQLYLSGQTSKEIKAATGVSSTVLMRARKARGIPARARRIELPDADIAAAYLAGESEYSLSLRYEVSRNVVRTRLREQGVEVRDMSTAGKVRAAKMTAEERSAQARAAHDAWRGSTYSYEQLCTRALSIEREARPDSPAEQVMIGWLRGRGVTPIPQKAIGKYNVDIAMAPIAVEILGGGWHAYKPTHAIRTPEILNAGWHLAFVWNHEGDSALGEHAADHVIAWLEEIRRNPPTVGQYRVISGDGHLLAAGSAKDDKFSLVPPPRGRSIPRSGHDRSSGKAVGMPLKSGAE